MRLAATTEETNARKTKTTFGVPSLQTASLIDDSDATNAALAAHYRFSARMRELEVQFEAKAGELRAAFLTELDGIRDTGAA